MSNELDALAPHPRDTNTEPDASEGQQPVAEAWRPSGKYGDEYRTDYEVGLDDGYAMARPSEQAVTEAGLPQFKEWFRKNYPGPYTIVHDPDWHAPKVYRAALKAAMEAG